MDLRDKAIEDWIEDPYSVSLPIRDFLNFKFYIWVFLNVMKRAYKDITDKSKVLKNEREDAINYIFSEDCKRYFDLVNKCGIKISYTNFIENIRKILKEQEND